MSLKVRLLTADDVEPYLWYMRLADVESGVDGVPHFHPYGRGEPYDMESAIITEHKRWATPLDQPGWRRAWGVFSSERDEPVGHLYFAGGMLVTEMHRVGMGMGLLRAYHRQGGGSLVLDTAIDWARNEPQIDWIDLGVFEENQVAAALYVSRGFVETGRTLDRFRVDGHRIDDISMSLLVGKVS